MNLRHHHALAVLLAMHLRPAGAQSVPPEAVRQFERVIGNRVEAVTILGGDHGAASGLYSFRGGTVANVAISKVGGDGSVSAPRPLAGKTTWSPVLVGNIGFISARNRFDDGYLAGNRMEYDTFALQLGAGARFQMTEHLSVIPTLSGIYGHTENEFIARNAVGQAVKQAASGTYVDWQLDTWSIDPAFELRYDWSWQRTRFEFGTRYTFFHTESFNSSSPLVRVEGDSHSWENKLDVDVPLGWRLLDCELHTGGFLSRTELFGNIADGLNANHVYTANGRFVLDLLGKVWKVRWFGVGASYFWGEKVNGWTAGPDGMTIIMNGAACDAVKTSAQFVTAKFPCQAVLEPPK